MTLQQEYRMRSRTGRQLYLPLVVSAGLASAIPAAVHAQVQFEDSGYASGIGVTPATNTYRAQNDPSLLGVTPTTGDPLGDLLDRFYPTIGIHYGTYKNVRRTSTAQGLEENQTEDQRLVITPALQYRQPLGRHQLMVTYTGVIAMNNEFDIDDFDSHRVRADLNLDVTERLDVDAYAGVGRFYEERGASGSRPFGATLTYPGSNNNFLEGPDEYDMGFYGASLIYGGVSRLGATLGYSYDTIEYTNNNQGIRDRDTDRVFFDLSYQVASRTSIFGRVSRWDVDYKDTLNDLDSENTSYGVGVRWAPTARLSGAIGIGREDKTFEDPGREDYEGTTYYANMNYLWKPYSSFQLYASRRAEETGEILSDYFISELFRLSWTHSLSERWSFGLYGSYIQDDFTSGREDEITDWGGRISYAFRHWLNLGVTYSKVERESNVPEAEFSDDIIGLSLGLGNTFGRR